MMSLEDLEGGGLDTAWWWVLFGVREELEPQPNVKITLICYVGVLGTHI